MKVIITGASGMVGKGALLECLDDSRIEKVLSIGRSRCGVEHPKLDELIHANFSEFESVKDQLGGYDACFACMGVSAIGMKEVEYHYYTYDMTIALANALHSLNTQMTMIYVSGVGTDSSEKGRSMWARVKGKTENALFNKGFRQAFAFRPGMIIPKRGIRSRTRWYQWAYDNLMWLIKLLKRMAPRSIVDTTQIGQAMIQLCVSGYDKQVILPPDILELAKRYSQASSNV